MPRDICEQQDGCSNLIEVFLECTSVEACCCMHGLQKWCKQADALNMAEIGMSGSKHMPQVSGAIAINPTIRYALQQQACCWP